MASAANLRSVSPTAYLRRDIELMTKTLTALAAIAAVAFATAAAPTTAEARCGIGCGLGLGIVGGVAAGAIIAGSQGPAYGGYAPVQGYEPYAYNGAYPVGCPGGYWARRPLVDRYGNLVGYSRPRFFCP
jgi:hypothetical protein